MINQKFCEEFVVAKMFITTIDEIKNSKISNFNVDIMHEGLRIRTLMMVSF